MQGPPQSPETIPVYLAPMAGITDLPFRHLVSGFGSVRVVSEMIASQDMLLNRPGTRARAELGFGIENTAVQLAGRDPLWIAEAAKLCEAEGAKTIDINMGCPAKKVTSRSGLGASGSALMREPDLALHLIEAVVGAVKVPVTLKMRLGWDENSLNAPKLARRAEAAGVTLITVHGRTRCQFYNGEADWAAIARVSRAVQIPVIANGDITSVSQARRALAASEARGVMIGRGARGKPWLPGRIAAALNKTRLPQIPDQAARVGLVQDHYAAILDFYGVELGCRAARKHLGWYMDMAATNKVLRRRVLTAQCPKEVLRLLPDALQDDPIEDLAA